MMIPVIYQNQTKKRNYAKPWRHGSTLLSLQPYQVEPVPKSGRESESEVNNDIKTKHNQIFTSTCWKL